MFSSHISARSALVGSRPPPVQGLSRVRDGVLVAEVDLNLCQEVKDTWGFQMTGRYPEYAELLQRWAKPDFQPQLVVDPALKSAL